MVPIALPRSAPSCGICGPQPAAPRHVENREGLLLAVAGQGTNEQQKSQLLFVLLPAPPTLTSPLSRCHTTKTPPTTGATYCSQPQPYVQRCGDVLKPCGCSVNVLCCCGGRGRAAVVAARAAATRSISRLTSAAVQVSASTSSLKPSARPSYGARRGTVGQLEATCQFVLLPTPSRELEGGRVELLERGRAASDGDGRASSRRGLARGRTRWRRACIGSWAHRGGGARSHYGYAAARGKAASEQTLATSSNITQCMTSRHGTPLCEVSSAARVGGVGPTACPGQSITGVGSLPGRSTTPKESGSKQVLSKFVSARGLSGPKP